MQKTMTRFLNNLIIFLFAIVPSLTIVAQEPARSDSVLGRPMKDFSTTAFCSYSSFHPSQYIADNNWDILCAFREPGSISKLDTLKIPYVKSQLQLLRVGDLLSYSNGTLKTKMPIFDKTQTEEIRNEAKQFSDDIYPKIESKVKDLVNILKKKGYGPQTYSLIFSYLLDGYIWSEGKLPSPKHMEDHGTWSGAYWAMYNKRPEDRNGTNGYGQLYVNWTDELGYWPNDKLLLSFAHCIGDNLLPIKDEELKNILIKWNLVDSNGNPTIPVIRRGNQDEIDKLCSEITEQISQDVKAYAPIISSSYNIPSPEEAIVIFYHEVMWDLLTLMESKGIIEKPAILKGEEVGSERFSDITFIVIDDERSN